jgi:ParB/RepB/Spo0J family partition protein
VFGMKSKKAIQEKADIPETNNMNAVEPYADEPASWNNLSDEQKADAWYHLALTNESSDPGTHQPGGDDFLWYMDAAAGGNRCAQYTLGKMYYKGVMTTVNPFQAGLWYSNSSGAGCPFADFELGKMSALGISMPENKDAASAYYQKSYEAFLSIDNKKQNKAIELKLAVMCENGLVNQADHNTAKHWRDLISGQITVQATVSDKEQENEDSASIKSDLSNGNLLTTNPNKGNQMDIPVEYIVPADDNKYAANDSDEDLNALAMSIQANGLINPITLNQKSKTKYQIISGERRFRAISKFLGWETIPSIVYYRLSSNKAQLMLHSANLDVREYTSGQKLQFYMETEKLLRKMQQSGEYDGAIQKGISELMGLSTHQIRKYQKIIDSLSKKQVRQVVNGDMNLEQAYNLAKLHVIRKDIPEPDLIKEQDAPGRTSTFESEPDIIVKQDTPGRASALQSEPDVTCEQNTPGRASALQSEPDVTCEQNTPGRASALQSEPDATEEQDTLGRASAFESEPEVTEEQDTLGRASALQPEPEVTEEQDTFGRTSAFESEPEVTEEQDTPGRASALQPEPDVIEEQDIHGRVSAFEDPESYQAALSLLPDLPIEPGVTCAVLNGSGAQSGYVDRIEIYNNALLISVLIDSIRMPYPVSMIGKTIFIGSGCFEQAERAI